MAMTWGWLNYLFDYYFGICRHISTTSGLNVIELFFQCTIFWSNPGASKYCPLPITLSWHFHRSLYVRTLWSICGWCVCCLVEWLHTWDLWGKNRKLATERSWGQTRIAKHENWADMLSWFFSPFIRSGPPVIHPKTSNIRCILGDQSSKFDPSPKPRCIAARFKSRLSKLQNRPPLPRVSELPLKP